MDRFLVPLRIGGFLFVVAHVILSFASLSSDEHTAYKSFGRLLRAPIFLIVAILWSILVFPFVFGATAVIALLQIVLYPLIQVASFVLGALAGMEKPPKLENYWRDFPDRYFRWLRFGMINMEEWTIKGHAN